MEGVIPYTSEARPDTGVTNVTLGMWLFLASEVMLFGALFSAYALLRTSATAWPDGGSILGYQDVLFGTLALTFVSLNVLNAARRRAHARPLLLASTVAALVFVVLKAVSLSAKVLQGLEPSASMFLALYFTLTGFHAAHVLGGAVANIWVARGVGRMDEAMTAGRLKALTLYWSFVDIVWFVILGLFYV